MAIDRYPDHRMEFAREVPEEWRRFAELREELLLDYGYNTARAYWADLQDWFDWAVATDKDVLQLTERDLRQYVALHRRRKYSESTIRRRVTALRLLMNGAVRAHLRDDNPAQGLVVRKHCSPSALNGQT